MCILNFDRAYLLCLQSIASGSFLQTCIDVVEQRLKFSHSEYSIIPLFLIHIVKLYRFKWNDKRSLIDLWCLVFIEKNKVDQIMKE